MFGIDKVYCNCVIPLRVMIGNCHGVELLIYIYTSEIDMTHAWSCGDSHFLPWHIIYNVMYLAA